MAKPKRLKRARAIRKKRIADWWVWSGSRTEKAIREWSSMATCKYS
jgi:hypothetical protein